MAVPYDPEVAVVFDGDGNVIRLDIDSAGTYDVVFYRRSDGGTWGPFRLDPGVYSEPINPGLGKKVDDIATVEFIEVT